MDVRQLGLSDEELEALGYRVSRPREAGEPPSETASPSHRREGSGVRAWLWTMAALVAVGWFARPTERMPAPVPANQPDTVFSSARAMSQLVDIARAPRPVGSPEHARVRVFLEERLAALGLETRIQERTLARTEGGAAVVSPVRNVLGRLPGSGPTGTLLVVAHYDGVPLSLGAGDNGIGLAAILETARVLQSAEGLRNDVVFLLSDAKELGSLGIAAFLEDHPWARDVRAAIVLDAVGVSGPAVWLTGDGEPTPIVDIAKEVVRNAASYSVIEPLAKGAPFGTELTAIRRREIPGMGLIVLGGRSAHGQALDRPVNVSEATLQHAGAQLLDLTRALGATDLRSIDGDTRDGGYASLPFGFVAHYPTAWGSLANLGLVLVFVLLVVLLRMRGGRWSGLLSGLAMGFVVVGLGGAAGHLTVRIAAALHPEMDRLGGTVYEEGALILAMSALVFAALTTTYALARRRYVRPELVVGASALPLAAVLTTTFMSPDAMVVLQPPLALALVASIVLILAPTKPTVQWGRVGACLAAGGVLFFLVPGLSVAADSMTLARAPVMGAIMGLGSLLLLPVVEWLGRPTPWAAPLVGIVVAGAAVGVSTPRFTDEARHPLPSSLVLLVEDTTTATFESADRTATDEILTGTSAEDAGRTAGRWMPSRWLTVPGVGESWARTWVVDATGDGSDPGPLLLPQSERWTVAGVGPDTFLPSPAVRVARQSDSSQSAPPADAPSDNPGLRTDPDVVEITIWSLVGAEMVAVTLPADAQAVFTHAGGVSLGEPGPALEESGDAAPVRAVRFWGRPEDGALRLTLRVRGAGSEARPPLVLDVVEHHLRPREILGGTFFQRADSVMADASTGSDRLVQRVQVRLPTF